VILTGKRYVVVNLRLLKHTINNTLALRENAAHQFAAKHALKIFSTKAIYTFIPKNACSTLRFSLALANGCIAGPEGINWIHNNNDSFRATLDDLITSTYSFVVLRDPFARLASAYLHKIVLKSPEAWALHNSLDRSFDLEMLSFTGFVSILGTLPRRSWNQHWRPQCDFLVYEKYDDYFCVENLAADGVTISTRAGLEIQDARPLTGHGTDQYTLCSPGACFAATPATDIRRLQMSGQCPHAQSLYTPDVVKHVRRLYNDDLELYARVIGRPLMFPPPPQAGVPRVDTPSERAPTLITDDGLSTESTRPIDRQN
jgi:Sulfotransferase family